MRRGVAAIFLLRCVLIAQPDPPSAHFEAASIHATSFEEARRQGLLNPMSISGTHVSLGAKTMNYLIYTAFGVRPAQVIGAPPVNADERYVIEAVMPGGAPREKIPEMLLALLKDRFHLTAHRETREVKGYALVRTKSPLKLQPPREIDKSTCSPWIDDPNSPGNQTCQQRFPDGTFGATTDPSPFGPTQTTTHGLDAKEEYLRMTMPQLASRLTIHFANLSCDPASHDWTPVEDRTGINGEYYIGMEVNTEDFCALPELYSSALEKYGLRLEKAIVRADLVIVDHVDKVPTEN